MREADPLEALVREWESPEPTPELDRRVISAYRSAIGPPHSSSGGWRKFWNMRVSVPAPALAALVLAIAIVLFWVKPSMGRAVAPSAPGAVTRLNVSGFQPLPNGEARVIPAVEMHK